MAFSRPGTTASDNCHFFVGFRRQTASILVRAQVMMQSNPWHEYLETRSNDAFTQVVQDHVHVVYSAGLRKGLGDRHFAEEMAQAVFTEIAQRPEIVPK